MSDTNYKDAFVRLPQAFWPCFYGELCAVSHMDILEVDPDCEACRAIDYYTGTSGWNVALWSTCKRLRLMDFYNWYDGLRWFESDEFDSVLSDGLVKKIEDSEAGAKNVYYMWLFNEKEGNDEESETE